MKAQDWKNDGSQIFHVSYEYPDSGKNIIGLPTKIVNGGVATEYTYDANGNITSATENKKKVSYVYDGLNRLVRENNELLNKTITYYYDEGGNLREEREYDYTTDPVSGTPKKLTTAVMDEKWKDKLLKWGSTEMTYDACGNMLKKGDTTFTWTQGRKLSAINNGKNIHYYYDHTGARVKKVVDGVTTEYRMAGSLLVSERTGDETIWYQYDSAASLVAMIIGGTRYNYVRNAQNDIIGLLDSTGKRVVSYKYNSWGKTVSITGTLAATVGQKNPFRYRGYYFDAESGMYYLQSRYYDPEIRRFISADDYGLLSASNTVYDKNLYIYCENNPIVRKDSNGKLWITAVAVGIAAQYVGDVIGNVIEGKKGIDILRPSSSIGEYVAAGVTALIPGSGLGGAFVRNIAAEGIASLERQIKGEENNLGKSIVKVAFGTAIDSSVEIITESISKHISLKMPQNYSSYARKAYMKNPKITQQKIRKNMSRCIRWGNRLAGFLGFAVDSFRSAMPL